MRKKKIPGKVRQFPTHYALVCSKRGCNGKLFLMKIYEFNDPNKDHFDAYQCIKCGMQYAPPDTKLGANFMTYGSD